MKIDHTSSRRSAQKIAALILLVLTVIFQTPRQGDAAAPRFVFLLIGDGMGVAQRNAAELYLAGRRKREGDTTPREAQLLMNTLPVTGTIRTDSLDGTTDSAAAATALATGKKTKNNAVGMNPASGERFVSIAKLARQSGRKVGIVTSAFLQDATPAGFYGQAEKRTEHYNLGRQLAESGFDYFGGGGFRNPAGRDKKQKNLMEIARAKGYRVINTADAFRALTPGAKTIAIHPEISAGAMPWAIDGSKSGLELADFVRKGIELLDNENGFFLLIEGAKIDLAGHANDAAAGIRETIAFDEALEVVLAFYRNRPDDTLVVVTSDHETGGMALRPSLDADAFYDRLSRQKGSYAAFERTISARPGAKIDAGMAKARSFFGPDLRATPAVQNAWRMSMTAKDKRPTKDKEYKKLYGPYDPFTMACIRELNAAAGITWTTFYHTGKDIPAGAVGAGAEAFAGTYENTGIFDRLKKAMNL